MSRSVSLAWFAGVVVQLEEGARCYGWMDGLADQLVGNIAGDDDDCRWREGWMDEWIGEMNSGRRHPT